ncbi:hypothetical protein BGX23_006645 [Mortierella sp. AD031]|nr:hypothetical protein BGX23_006645 [Mortierella sp. AD031]
MTKSLRGTFNYVNINMYKPFNSSVPPATSSGSSQGYRGPSHDAQAPSFSDPSFSPTVHVPQSTQTSSYRSSFEVQQPVGGGHFGSDNNHGFECQPQHDRHSSLDAGHRPGFDVQAHHNLHNTHLQQQEPQSRTLYQAFNSQPRDFGNHNHNDNSFGQHHNMSQHHGAGHQYNGPQQFNGGQQFNGPQQFDGGQHQHIGVPQHSDVQHNNVGQQHNTAHQQPGPAVQLINNMNPARLAVLEGRQAPPQPATPTIPPRSPGPAALTTAPRPPAPTPKKKKGMAKAWTQINNKNAASIVPPVITANSNATTATAPRPVPAPPRPVALSSMPTPAPSNPTAAPPTPGITPPTSAAAPPQIPNPYGSPTWKDSPAPVRTDPPSGPLAPQLAMSLRTNSQKKVYTIIKRAAGECILRALVYILGRNFVFMSRELILTTYREAFHCPNLKDPDQLDVLLETRNFTGLFELHRNGKRKYYRLHPGYIKSLAKHAHVNDFDLPPTRVTEGLYDVEHRSVLPPITPIPDVAVRYLVDAWKAKMINITLTFYPFIPARWPTSSPLNDLQPFLAHWYTPSFQFTEHIVLKRLANNAKPGQVPSPTTVPAPSTSAAAPSMSAAASSTSSASATSTSQSSSPATSSTTQDNSDEFVAFLRKTAKEPTETGREARQLLLKKGLEVPEAGSEELSRPSSAASNKEGDEDELSDNSDMELDDDDDDEAPAINLTPAPVPMTVYPPVNDSTSTSTPTIQDPTNGPAAVPVDNSTSTSTPTIQKPMNGPASVPMTVCPPVTDSASAPTPTPTIQEPTNGPASVPMTVCSPFNDSTSTSRPITQEPSNGATMPGQIPAQHRDKMTDRTGGAVRFSMRQERFMPYANTHRGEGVFGSQSERQGRSTGEGSALTKNGSSLPRPDLPLSMSLSTLPQPSLPPLDGQGTSSANTVALAMLAGQGGSDMTGAEPLLRRSRDDILNQRRSALEEIISMTMKLPMRMGSRD